MCISIIKWNWQACSVLHVNATPPISPLSFPRKVSCPNCSKPQSLWKPLHVSSARSRQLTAWTADLLYSLLRKDFVVYHTINWLGKLIACRVLHVYISKFCQLYIFLSQSCVNCKLFSFWFMLNAIYIRQGMYDHRCRQSMYNLYTCCKTSVEVYNVIPCISIPEATSPNLIVQHSTCAIYVDQ